jgi:hypothetical protein
MTFAEAFDRAEWHVQRMRRQGDLEYRYNQRFKLWQRRLDDPLVLRAQHFSELRERAYPLAAEAEADLAILWDHISRAVPPLGHLGAVAMCSGI